MATWKQLVFSDDVPNLGNQDLSIKATDYTRDFVLKQNIAGTPYNWSTTKKTFRFMSESAFAASESPLLTIDTPAFSSDGGTSAGGSFFVSTTDFGFAGESSAFKSDTTHVVSSPVVQFDTTDFTIFGGNDAAAAAPILSLHRSSDSPADGDELGQISFKGEDSSDYETAYATITGSIVDQTDNTEDGGLDIRLRSAGVEGSVLKLHPNDVTLSTTDVTIVGGDSGSADAPTLSLHRDSTSPDPGDELGQISFKGENSVDNITAYATITGSIVDPSQNKEDGGLDIRLRSAGVEESALKLLPQPTDPEFNAGTAAAPKFYTDQIRTYQDVSLREMLLNEIGVTKSFEVFFYETNTHGIQAGYEVWGLSAPVSTPGNSDYDNKSIRYATAPAPNVDDTFIHYSVQGALNVYTNQLNDLGGGSWIMCHHDTAVTPYQSGKGMTYTFNGVFFYRQPDYYGEDSYTLDNETAGTIRIYQATTTGTEASGGLSTVVNPDAADSIGYTLQLMAKQNIAFEDGHDLTSVPFSLPFNGLGGGSPYDLFVVTFENTGPLTLGYDDAGEAADLTQTPYYNSTPFIKGEITRRIANEPIT